MTNITMAPNIAPTARQANAIPTAPPVVNTIKNKRFKRKTMQVKCKRDKIQGTKAYAQCFSELTNVLYGEFTK